MTIGFALWLAAAVATFLTATTALRAHVGSGTLGPLLIALALYTVGNLMMVRVMRAGGMAAAISASSVLQLVAANLIAVAAFGERPSLTQWAGIGLGMVAVALLLWPEGDE